MGRFDPINDKHADVLKDAPTALPAVITNDAPPDAHNCTTGADLERSELDGNLYAYKVLVVNRMGEARSYYRGAAGVWGKHWRTAKCLPKGAATSPELARAFHGESPDPLPGLCECGFHSWYVLPPLTESPYYKAIDAVPVVVQIGGDVLYAARGTRSERCRVLAVLDCGNDESEMTVSEHRKEYDRRYPTRADLAAYMGGLPVLRPGDVELWAAVEGLRPASDRMSDLMREDVV